MIEEIFVVYGFSGSVSIEWLRCLGAWKKCQQSTSIVVIIIIWAALESSMDVSCFFITNAYAFGRGRTIFQDFKEKPEVLSRASTEIQTR